jgi:flagellar hook-associated protein 2
LSSLLGTPATGVTGDYTTLSSVGVSVQSDGSLKIDDDQLTKVLGTDPEAVSRLLIDDKGAGTVGVFAQFKAALTDMTSGTDGAIAQRISGIASRVKDINSQMDRMEQNITEYQDNLNQQFANMEEVMSKLQSQGNQLTAMLSGLK